MKIIVSIILAVTLTLTACSMGSGGLGPQQKTPVVPAPPATLTAQEPVSPVATPALAENIVPFITANEADPQNISLTVNDVVISQVDDGKYWYNVIVNVTLTNNHNTAQAFDVKIKSGDDTIWHRDPTINTGLKDNIAKYKLSPGESVTGNVGFAVWPYVCQDGFEVVVWRVTEGDSVRVDPATNETGD